MEDKVPALLMVELAAGEYRTHVKGVVLSIGMPQRGNVAPTIYRAA